MLRGEGPRTAQSPGRAPAVFLGELWGQVKGPVVGDFGRGRQEEKGQLCSGPQGPEAGREGLTPPQDEW